MRSLLLRSKKIWLLLGAVLLSVLAISGILVAKKINDASAASTEPQPIEQKSLHLYSDGPNRDYGQYTDYFRLEGINHKDDNHYGDAWCAQAFKATPTYTNSRTATNVNVYDVNDIMANKDKYGDAAGPFKTWFNILYYGNERLLKNSDGNAYSYMEVHFAISRAYNGDASKTGNSTLDSRARKLWTDAAAMPLPTGKNYLYVAYNGDGQQTVMTYVHEDYEYVTLNVEKTWVDNDDHYKLRPRSITVYLVTDNVRTNRSITLSAPNWSGSFGTLDAGHNYSISEPEIANYSSSEPQCSFTDSEHIQCSITNSFDKEYVSLPVSKVWLDDDNADLTRPEKVRVWLYSDGAKTNKYLDLTADENGDWSGEFTDLEKGPVYTAVEETDANGHIAVAQGEEDSRFYDNTNTDCSEGRCVFYNLLKGSRYFPVTKIWDDHGQEDKRPSSIQLIIEGSDGSVRSASLSTKDIKDNITWERNFGVPTYDNEGVEIVYTVKEKLIDGTTYVYDGESYEWDGTTGNMYNGFTITNKLEETVGLTVSKRWLDNGNSGVSTRPESITFTILKDGVAYGDPIVLNDSDAFFNQLSEEEKSHLNPELADFYMNTWVRYIDGLPRYDENDNEINWTVSEEAVAKYDQNKKCWRTPITDRESGVVDSYSYYCEVTNLRDDYLSISVEKTWVDGENDVRPSVVNFIVRQFYYPDYGGGSRLPRYYDVISVSAVDNWSVTVPGFPKYDSKGRELTYDLIEMPVGPYISEQVGDAVRDEDGNYSFTFKNTKTSNTNIEVIKCWVDGNNLYDTRPESLRFILTQRKFDQDGAEITPAVTSDIILTAENAVDNCWMKSIENLPLLDGDGNTYTYEVEEDKTWLEDTDYSTDDEECNPELSEWTCRFVNDLEGKTSKSGTKTWLDDNNKKNLRPNPDDFEILLYRNADSKDEELLDIDPTWVQNNDGKTWTYTFSNLDLYDEDGFKYHYRVFEKDMTISLDNGDSYGQVSRGINDFTNLLSGKIDYCGKKVWNDYGAPSTMRPESIVVALTRDDGQVETRTVSASSSDEALELCGENVSTVDEVWYFKFENLDKYDSEGREYSYTLSENSDIASYTTTIAQSTGTIINTYQPKPIKLTVNKIWLNDSKDDRPKSIKVTLYQDGEVYETVELNDENGWSHTWDPLDGNFEWTTTEDVHIENYGTEIRQEEDENGNIVVNIYNTKTPDTGDKGTAKYMFVLSGVLLSGLAVSRKLFARR